MVVEPDLLSHRAALHHAARTVLNGGDVHAEPLVAVDIAVVQAVDLMLHEGVLGLPGVVDDKLLHHGGEAANNRAGGLVPAAVPVALTVAVAVPVCPLPPELLPPLPLPKSPFSSVPDGGVLATPLLPRALYLGFTLTVPLSSHPSSFNNTVSVSRKSRDAILRPETPLSIDISLFAISMFPFKSICAVNPL